MNSQSSNQGLDMTQKKIRAIAIFYGMMQCEDTFLDQQLQSIQKFATGAEVVVIKIREEFTREVRG